MEANNERSDRTPVSNLSSPGSLRTFVQDTGEQIIIQMEGIKSVRQEKKGWYYGDDASNTILVKYFDKSWERLNMTVREFNRQAGI